MALSMTSVSFMFVGGSISKIEKRKTGIYLPVECMFTSLIEFRLVVPVLCVMKTGVLEAGLSPRPAIA